ncbi:MAG: septum formation initiator family protein [Bacteroidales bacterium]|jgi:cell division protein DivIC|nr:septum formation initiator family protein [Bacteroidales bacterium]
MIRLKFINKIPSVFRNKYFLTLLIFFIWLIFLDSNNLIARYREMRELRKLKNDREYYLNKIENDRSKLRELKTDNHNLEKFAREQYRMKKPDEDLFIVLTPKEDRKITRKNN